MTACGAALAAAAEAFSHHSTVVRLRATRYPWKHAKGVTTAHMPAAKNQANRYTNCRRRSASDEQAETKAGSIQMTNTVSAIAA